MSHRVSEERRPRGEGDPKLKTIVTLIGIDGRTEGTWIVPTDDSDDLQTTYYKKRDAIPVITNGWKLMITTIGEDADKSGKSSSAEKPDVALTSDAFSENKKANQDNERSATKANMTVLNTPPLIQSFTDAVVLSTMDQMCAAQLAEEGDIVQAEAMFINALEHMEKFQNTEQFQTLAENYVRFLYDLGRLKDAENYCIRNAAMYFWKKFAADGELSFSPEAGVLNQESPRVANQQAFLVGNQRAARRVHPEISADSTAPFGVNHESP